VQISYAIVPVKAVRVPRFCVSVKNIQEMNERVYTLGSAKDIR